jgi:hypothetical protein
MPDMRALREGELAALNLDTAAAVTTVLGALPKIRRLRDHLLALQGIDEALIDDLEDYASAAAEAHSRFRIATTRRDHLIPLNRKAAKLRETLKLDVQALVRRGLIEPARVASFKGRTGYKNVAFELIGYANLLRASWPRIEGRTAIPKQDIEEALRLGDALVRAAGERQQGSAVAEASNIRQRAMTLLLRSYDEVRRAIAFLRRHEGDAERIAPSLRAGRGGRGKCRPRHSRGTEPVSGSVLSQGAETAA